MGRPRTPSGAASLYGSDIKNPRRYSGRDTPSVQALGPAPDYLDATEKAVWTDIASDLPWLGKSDRCILAIATRLMTRLRTDPAMGVNAIAQLRMCLSSLGATPADRSKVSVPDDPDDDPAAEFLC